MEGMVGTQPKDLKDLKVNTGMTLKASVLQRLDETRGDVSRSRAIERVLEDHLGMSRSHVVERDGS